MKKFMNYLLNCLVLLAFVIVISVIYHLRLDKTAVNWLFYTVSQDVLLFLPVCAALGILWGMVIRSKSETSQQAGGPFFIILYVILVMGGAVLFQEVMVPKLYDLAVHNDMRKANKTPEGIVIKDVTGPKFTMGEFKNLRFMDSRKNLAFYMGSSLVYMEGMYNGNGSYYVSGFKFIAYKDKGVIDYILTADYAKIYDYNIYAVSPTYLEYRNGSLYRVKNIDGSQKVPLSYDPAGIFNLTSDYRIKVASLVDVFLYNDYIYGSNINFYRLGNIVFNKIAFYIMLILLLITSSSFGTAYKNQRLVGKDIIIQTVSFYIVSAVLSVLCYDILLSLANMIYGIMA